MQRYNSCDQDWLFLCFPMMLALNKLRELLENHSENCSFYLGLLKYFRLHWEEGATKEGDGIPSFTIKFSQYEFLILKTIFKDFKDIATFYEIMITKTAVSQICATIIINYKCKCMKHILL